MKSGQPVDRALVLQYEASQINLTELLSDQDDFARAHVDTAEIRFFFLPYGHLDFESAVAEQSDESKCSFHSSYSRLLNVKP